jgi:hypothetical protein
MDRIAALRNVEDALRSFEEGEADLAETEAEVATILRTFATEFEADDRQAYRVRLPGGAGDGGDVSSDRDAVTPDSRETVVVADSPTAARERAADRADCDPGAIEVDPAGSE